LREIADGLVSAATLSQEEQRQAEDELAEVMTGVTL
jgi:hypothetical protein